MITNLLALAARATSNASNEIANISTIRFENISNAWGGWSPNQTGAPDWGLMLWNIVSIYPDVVGPIAWFVLFSIPFVMMWLSHADIVPVAIVGMFFGIYVATYLPAQVMYIGVAFMVFALVAIVLALWKK